MKDIKTSQSIQEAYDNQYSDNLSEWRRLGAKHKALNIMRVTSNNIYDKVLEYGAGEGSILQYLNKNSNFKSLYALEISNSGIEQIKKLKLDRLQEIKKFDGYHTDYADDEFDLVYCAHVIEHVEHPRLVLREIRRISKAQVFEIPLDYSKNVDTKIKHYMGYGHLNIYTPSLFKYLLKTEGFQIEEEYHSVMAKEVLEYLWYQSKGFKKTLKRKIMANIYINKAKIAKIIKGKAVADEYYNSAYTCFTRKTKKLNIF